MSYDVVIVGGGPAGVRGGEPTSSCAKGWLGRDEHGFLITGPDVLKDGARDSSWTLDRDFFSLESSRGSLGTEYPGQTS